MTTIDDLTRDLGGVIPGFDDPLVALELSDGRVADDVFRDLLMAFDPAERDVIRTTIETDRPLVLLAHVEHPCLPQIYDWTHAHDDVVLIAGYPGPRPPAVLVLRPKGRDR